MLKARDLLGKNVRRLREDLSWTQADLAEKSDLSVKMIQKIEYGKTSPTPETIDKIARAFKCEVEQLYLQAIRAPEVSRPRSSQNWKEIADLMESYSNSSPERRLLAFYVLTNDDSYLDEFVRIPGAAPIAKVLKKVL